MKKFKKILAISLLSVGLFASIGPTTSATPGNHIYKTVTSSQNKTETKVEYGITYKRVVTRIVTEKHCVTCDYSYTSNVETTYGNWYPVN